MIDTKPYFFKEKLVALIEKKYKAKFVCESCIKLNKDSWRNDPSLIFYSEVAHPQGSNYFAVSEQNGSLIICDGISATEPFVGIIAANGDVIYSRFRHDYRRSPDNSVDIDGGRDYTKTSISPDENRFKMPTTVLLQIVKDQVMISNDCKEV